MAHDLRAISERGLDRDPLCRPPSLCRERIESGAFDQAKFNAASMKADGARTPAEKELIRLHDPFLTREVYKSPVLQFVEDHTEPGSFQYVGAGAKVGQADRILCWFTTRGTTRLRGVFAHLSVRDVARSGLPLDLAK